MKKLSVESIIQNTNSLTNGQVKGMLDVFEGGYLVWKIDERLKELGLTQSELSEITGLRPGTISNLVNASGLSKSKINFTYLLAIMSALRVTNLSDIVEFRVTSEVQDRFEVERSEWERTHQIPFTTKEEFKKNKLNNKTEGLLD